MRFLNHRCLSGLLISLSLLHASAGATIEGAVTLPPAKTAPGATARYSAKAAGEIAKPEPAAAVVYLEGVKTAAVDKPAKGSMAQKEYQFAPGLLVVQVGTEVAFPNMDENDYHNVFSVSKVKRFNLGRYRAGEQPATQVFDQPGVVKLYCEIHEHMRGTILVLDTPHFIKTDAEGKYSLKELPAGDYVLKVWIDEKTTWSKPVTLKDGETLKVDFAKP